jgi:hypothetical protein
MQADRQAGRQVRACMHAWGPHHHVEPNSSMTRGLPRGEAASWMCRPMYTLNLGVAGRVKEIRAPEQTPCVTCVSDKGVCVMHCC